MENCVIVKLCLVEISDIVKFCTPKTYASVENGTMEVSTTVKCSFTKTSVQCSFMKIVVMLESGFIKVYVCLKNRTSEGDLLLKNDSPKIDYIFESAPGTR